MVSSTSHAIKNAVKVSPSAKPNVIMPWSPLVPAFFRGLFTSRAVKNATKVSPSTKPKAEVSPSAKPKAKLESNKGTAKPKSNNKVKPITARLLKSKNYRQTALKGRTFIKGEDGIVEIKTPDSPPKDLHAGT